MGITDGVMAPFSLLFHSKKIKMSKKISSSEKVVVFSELLCRQSEAAQVLPAPLALLTKLVYYLFKSVSEIITGNNTNVLLINHFLTDC